MPVSAPVSGICTTVVAGIGNPVDVVTPEPPIYAAALEYASACFGHASAVETLDTYSHLWPDSDDRTRDAID